MISTTKFELYETNPPQVQALRITEDILSNITKCIAAGIDLPSSLAAIPLFSSVVFGEGRRAEIYMLGFHGIQYLHAGDWIIVHPDSRTYIITDLRFQAEYHKVTPRVTTITGMEH